MIRLTKISIYDLFEPTEAQEETYRLLGMEIYEDKQGNIYCTELPGNAPEELTSRYEAAGYLKGLL